MQTKKKLDDRFTFLEIETIKRELDGSNLNFPFETIQKLQNAEDQRFIKTHLPLSLLPDDLLEKAKVIYRVSKKK